MRKIISKKQEARKQRIKQIGIGIVLVLIMVMSVIGYSFNKSENTEEKVVYNGIEFVKENNLWNANIGDFQFSFLYNPNEVEQINSQLNYLNNYYDKPLYIYSESSDAGTEIYRNLFYNGIVQRIQYACLDGLECEGDLPIKSCADNFIIIEETEKTEIIQEDNCVYIKGKKEDLVKIIDGFLLKIIGVQQNL